MAKCPYCLADLDYAVEQMISSGDAETRNFWAAGGVTCPNCEEELEFTAELAIYVENIVITVPKTEKPGHA